MAWQCRAAASGEHVKSQIQPARQPLDPERRGARGGELDGEWNAVQAATDGGDRRGVALAEVKMRIGGAGAGDEQPHRIMAQGGRELRGLLGGELQRTE